MGSRRVINYRADVIDSIRSDWTISDDGDDRGPIDGWPAPFMGVDDGSNAAARRTLRRAGVRSGIRFDQDPRRTAPTANLIPRQVRGNIMFHDGGLNKLLRGAPPSKLAQDAFADVRHEDALFSRTGVEGDAYRFLRRQDQGADNTYAPRKGPHVITSTSATMAGAGDLDRRLDWGIVDDAAGAIHDAIGQWALDTIARIKQTPGANLSKEGEAEIHRRFYVIVQNVGSSQFAWKAVSEAHQAVDKVWRQALGGKAPPKDRADEMTRHMTSIGSQVQPGGVLKAIGSVASDIGKGAFSVVKGAVNVVGGAAQIVGKLALSPAKLAADIASGKNVFQSLKDTVKRDLASAKELAPYAQAVLSVVPGVGQGVNAAIAAGAALAQGQNITDALVAGVKGMVPGGPIAQKALETAYNVAKGQSVSEAALSTLRDQLPAGPARIAFDTGVALAQGKNIQEVAKGQGMALISETTKALSPYATAPMSKVGPIIGKVSQTAMAILPPNVKQVANALLQNPGLRSLPVAEVARRMNVPESVARDAVASVMQAAQRTGIGQAVKALAPAPDIANRIGTATTFDQNLARFGSQVAPKVFSPNAIRPVAPAPSFATIRKALPRLPHLMPGAMGLQDAGAFATLRVGSTGPDVALWQRVIGVKDDGKFGPATDSATRTWQRKMGLVADGIVGQKSWDKATALGLTGSAPMLPAPTQSQSPGTVTLPEVVIAAAPPPPLTSTQIAAANSMPTIREGNSGKAVETWQGILKRDSGISGYALPIDGKFGPLTTTATKKWQSSSGLVADGVVGPKSWTKAIGSLTTAPLPAESAPGVALPTPVPPNLPPGLPPVPTQPAAPPASVPVMALPPPIFGTTPQPVVISPVPGVAPVVIADKPPAILPTTPQTKDEKAGNAVAALAVGALAAKLFGIF